jgi:hypothetical protein
MDVLRFLKRLVGFGPTLRPPPDDQPQRWRSEWERRQAERRLEMLEAEARLMQRRTQTDRYRQHQNGAP